MSFVSQLFATTNVDKLRELGSRRILKRALTAKDLIAIGLGTMIGGGIFTTIGTGVKGAGPAVIISYLLAGLTSFFAALCYAELGAMVPVAGSAYTYAYATMGKLFAWIIGFALIFEYGISAAPVAQQFSAAIQDVFASVGVSLPAWAQQSNLIIHGPWWQPGSWDLLHSQYDIVGALFVLALSALLSVGIRESATTNNIFVVLKISALVVFVIAGLWLFKASHFVSGPPQTWWNQLSPHGWGSLKPFGGAVESAQPYGIVARRWCSSATSASTPRRRPPKSARIHSATYLWASSAHSRSARSFTVRPRSCSSARSPGAKFPSKTRSSTPSRRSTCRFLTG